VVFRPDNPGYAGTIGIPAIAAITAGGGSFKGSMLVESSQPLAVVVKLADVPVGSMGRAGGTASAFYNGLSMKSSGYDTGIGGGELRTHPVAVSGSSGPS
jgi:hypothetical protein